MMGASDSLSAMVGAMMGIDYTQVGREFGPLEAEQLARLDARQKELMPYMEAFLSELETTALMMRSCAR